MCSICGDSFTVTEDGFALIAGDFLVLITVSLICSSALVKSTISVFSICLSVFKSSPIPHSDIAVRAVLLVRVFPACLVSTFTMVLLFSLSESSLELSTLLSSLCLGCLLDSVVSIFFLVVRHLRASIFF
uniref:Uncharacterized protein n=1 Tax=Cacopsylla melanoneura TaxID=428564 RepID=A0A8D8YRP4_9HEMI